MIAARTAPATAKCGSAAVLELRRAIAVVPVENRHLRGHGRRQWEVGPPVIYSWLGTGWRRTRRILHILLRHCRGRSAEFVTRRGEDDSEHRGPLICDRFRELARAVGVRVWDPPESRAICCGVRRKG
jgi:hypothetical protein